MPATPSFILPSTSPRVFYVCYGVMVSTGMAKNPIAVRKQLGLHRSRLPGRTLQVLKAYRVYSPPPDRRPSPSPFLTVPPHGVNDRSPVLPRSLGAPSVSDAVVRSKAGIAMPRRMRREARGEARGCSDGNWSLSILRAWVDLQ